MGKLDWREKNECELLVILKKYVREKGSSSEVFGVGIPFAVPSMRWGSNVFIL